MTGKAHQAERSLALLDAGGVANRVLGTVDGTTMAMQQATGGMAPGLAVRAATKVVATTNAAWASSAQMQASADYLCDGVADEVQINAALAALPASGGSVLLAEGEYVLAAPLALGGANRALRGVGMHATMLRVAPNGGAPINATIIPVAANFCELADFTINGDKATNAAQTQMILIQVATAQGVLVQRVRTLNDVNFGLIVQATASNGIIRDCLFENAAKYSPILRASPGQPLVVSGCTAKGGAMTGFYCDDGPVALSDCQALNNATAGFSIIGTAAARLINCVAIGSDIGFDIAAPRAQLINCRATGSTAAGFRTYGVRPMLIGCLATGTTSGDGFTNNPGAVGTLHVGCAASNSGSEGFTNIAGAKATYVGCRALDDYSFGFFADSASPVHLHGCLVDGALTAYGIYIQAPNSLISGCRAVRNGGSGIAALLTSLDTLVVGNTASENGLVTNDSYENIWIRGTTCFLHGNVSRDPPSGNRPWAGIYVDGPNTFVGQNDAYGSGTAGAPSGIYEQYIEPEARIAVKILLNYTATTDIAAGAVAANTWTDVSPSQSFVVGSPNSLVEVICRGSILTGNRTYRAPDVIRVLIDGSWSALLSGESVETSSAHYQNVLGSAQPIKIQGLAAGTHTIKIQLNMYYTGNVYLRAASAPQQEYLQFVVTEHAR